MKCLSFRNYFISALFALIACSKSSSSASGLSDQLIASQWSIHYYYDNTDKTGLFSGFIFTFNNNSSVKAVNGSTVFNGSWSVQKNGDGTLVLSINFSSGSPVQLLNDSWKVTNNNGTLLQLSDDSASPAKTLHFIRQ